jgi:hypothetical protein
MLRDRLFRPYTPLHFQTRRRAMMVAINAFEKTLCIFTTMALRRHIGFTLFAGWRWGNDREKESFALKPLAEYFLIFKLTGEDVTCLSLSTNLSSDSHI